MLTALALLVAGYLGFGALVFVFQRRLVYFPDRTRPEPASHGAGDMRVVRYSTADGLALAAWYRPPANAGTPVIVHFHGNAGHIGDRAPLMRRYIEVGYGVLLAEYRGYGGNPGRPTEAGLYEDGRAALDFLARQGIEAGRIVLYGESLGTAVAVAVAAERPVGAVVLEAPFTSAVDIGVAVYPFLPVRWLMLDRFNLLRRIGAIRAPLLVLHGEQDETVPAAHGRRVLAAAPEPKEGRFFAAAGHDDLHAFGIVEEVVAFLTRHGVGSGASDALAVGRGQGDEGVRRIDVDQHRV
ncbi:MAG TPA: alpha/beta hydrolase [Alphaproteobacteria bacterium]